MKLQQVTHGKAMKDRDKEQIKKALRRYADRFESQNKAANSLKGVSSATVSQMLSEHWELIKDEMWRNVASQIGHEENQWQGVQTGDFKRLTALLRDAQAYSDVFAIMGDAGTGKTYCLKQYVRESMQAYLVCCNEYWNRRYFLLEILTVMGCNWKGLTSAEMLTECVRQLKKRERPLLILDEADKLSDRVLFFFITLYNQLEDRCGIVLCATDHLEKRLERGLFFNKRGYKEIWSRVGRKVIALKGLTFSDVVQVCAANGIQGHRAIKEIYKGCCGDLRRVRREIDKLKRSLNSDLRLIKD